MSKKIALIILFTLVLFACKPQYSAAPNSTIFFTFEGKENWEIWKVNRDGTQFENIYKIPRGLSFYEAQQQIITSKIATELRNEPFLLKDSEILETNIWDIQLSPNQKMLSWRELVLWCPGNYCIGQSAIRIFDLDSNILINSYATTDEIGTESWSPDSKYIVFDQINEWHFDGLPHSIELLGVTNLESVRIGEGYHPVFAKDKNIILAYFLEDDEITLSCCQVINPQSGEIEKKLFAGDFGQITLSPDGKDFAAVLYENNLKYPSIINLQSQHIKKLDMPFDNQTITTIEWSPNGKRIAIAGAIPFQLAVLDMTGALQLNIEGVSRWDWADNGNEVIFVRQNDAYGCNAIEPYIYTVTISNGELSKMDFPSPIKNLLTEKNKYDCQTNLIGEIVW